MTESAELPAAKLFAPTPKAARRVVEFFTTQINNDHTRRAYLNATQRFSRWCAVRGVEELASVQPVHVAAFLKELQREASAPTVKQHLAALRVLFDWLTVGHVLEVNPAHAVRGPKHVVRKGRTPVLTAEEARTLLDSINTSSLVGLRDRALIGTIVYTFARIGAVLQMNVRDYFTQGRRGWVRLHEKGGKEHEAPCHHKSGLYMDEYLAASGFAHDGDGPLWRTTGRKSGTPQRMTQPDAYLMVERRARRAGIKTKIGNHSLRSTGVTDYLRSDGSLAEARRMANHADTRATPLSMARACLLEPSASGSTYSSSSRH
ncbi:MAG: tyrosine-type recombinase/integrase [Acidobacteriaceae bacterium]|nr:tyrosine-type recombinase/integrase [Acidobacteriaceae bacterium]